MRTCNLKSAFSPNDFCYNYSISDMFIQILNQ